MFLSLLQFLFASRSEVVMINAYEWSDLLDDLLKKVGFISVKRLKISLHDILHTAGSGQ